MHASAREFWYSKRFANIAFILTVLFVIGGFKQVMHAAKASGGGSSSLPMAKPEDLGFSSERLAKIHDVMQKHIDSGEIAGVVLMISKNGKVVYHEAQGWSNVAEKKPMAKDSMFNLASGSKIIVATAIMSLVEDGKIHLNDPLSMYIPEFKNEQVRVFKPGTPLGRGGAPPSKEPEPLVPAQREITIRDLLTHTSGMMGFGAPPWYKQPSSDLILTTSLADFMGIFAKVPLEFQPGTRWAYSNWAGFDILGRVVEVITGKPYPQYVKDRFFDPLGMKDIGWGIIPKGDDPRGPRVAQRYQYEKGGLKVYDSVWSTSYKTYISACCGATTTAEDYWKFIQMLANDGEANGKRFLSPLSVELMRTNHVGDLYAKAGTERAPGGPSDTTTVAGATYAPGGPEFGNPGMGFGFGTAITMDRGVADTLLPNGSYSFAGASGCRFIVSPKENIVLTFMVNGGRFAFATKDFETMAMQAYVGETGKH